MQTAQSPRLARTVEGGARRCADLSPFQPLSPWSAPWRPSAKSGVETSGSESRKLRLRNLRILAVPVVLGLLLLWRSGWCFHLKVSQGLHKPTSIYLKLRQQCHVWTAIIFESEATFHIAWTVLAFCMLSSSWCLVCKNQDPVAPQRLLRSITCRERCFDCIRM